MVQQACTGVHHLDASHGLRSVGTVFFKEEKKVTCKKN